MADDRITRWGLATGAGIAQVIASLLWLGLLLGVSFLATPVKFMAPSLSLLVALDVGRHTFAVFSWVELGLALVLAVSALARPNTWTGLCVAALGAIVLAQAFYVLPTLDARLDILFAGETPAPSSLHTVYIGLDGLKLVVLSGLAALAFRDVLRH